MVETIGKLILKLLMPGMVMALAADLLYLYFVGAWYDPNPLIEWAEVIVLFFLAIGGLVLFVKECLTGWAVRNIIKGVR